VAKRGRPSTSINIVGTRKDGDGRHDEGSLRVPTRPPPLSSPRCKE
jgi:hypothetical protein